MMKAILYDRSVADSRQLLQSFLTTPWDLEAWPDVSDRSAVRAALADADAFVGNAFPADLRGAGAKLRLVHCVGAGVDQIDTDAMPPGCALCNVYEHEIPIAEYIMLTILTFVTGLPRVQEGFRRGQWDDSSRGGGRYHEEAFGKTVGLIGYGHIGRTVAARVRAFGMKVMAVGRRPRQTHNLDGYGTMEQLPELLRAADFVVVVCPLTAQTRGMIAAEQLRLLKPSAYLINVARAEIIDEAALYEALSQRWFAGAALDVWYRYPPRPGEVMHGSRHPFHELQQVIVTPHFSAWTEPLVHRRCCRIAENLDRLARGEPLERVVHPAAGQSHLILTPT